MVTKARILNINVSTCVSHIIFLNYIYSEQASIKYAPSHQYTLIPVWSLMWKIVLNRFVHYLHKAYKLTSSKKCIDLREKSCMLL